MRRAGSRLFHVPSLTDFASRMGYALAFRILRSDGLAQRRSWQGESEDGASFGLELLDEGTRGSLEWKSFVCASWGENETRTRMRLELATALACVLGGSDDDAPDDNRGPGPDAAARVGQKLYSWWPSSDALLTNDL